MILVSVGWLYLSLIFRFVPQTQLKQPQIRSNEFTDLLNPTATLLPSLSFLTFLPSARIQNEKQILSPLLTTLTTYLSSTTGSRHLPLAIQLAKPSATKLLVITIVRPITNRPRGEVIAQPPLKHTDFPVVSPTLTAS